MVGTFDETEDLKRTGREGVNKFDDSGSIGKLAFLYLGSTCLLKVAFQ
jgi:hypothetical protein